MSLSSRQEAVLELAQKDEVVRDHFFRHAEGIVWFNELRTRGLLNAEQNPRPFEAADGTGLVVPFWNALDYVAKTARSLRPDDAAAGKLILEFVREVSDYARENHIDNFRTFYKLGEIVASLSPSLLEMQDVERAALWLNSRFNNSLVAAELANLMVRVMVRGDQEGKGIAQGLLNVLTAVLSSDQAADGELKSTVEPYWLKKLLTDHLESLVTELGKPVVALLSSRVQLASEVHHWNGRSHWYRQAIEDHEQDAYKDKLASAVFVSALRDALCVWTKKDRAAIGEAQILLHGEATILRRIAIHVIDRNFDELRELVGGVVAPQFFVDENRHEVYQLLRNRFASLGAGLQKVTLDVIESVQAGPAGDAETERWSSYVRLCWLHAIKDSPQAEVQALYAKYLQIVGREPEHPDFTSYTSSGWVVHKSPRTPDELVAMTPTALVEFANSFKGDGGWMNEQPDEDGLADSFEQAAKLNRSYFFGSLAELRHLRPRYLSRVIMGLSIEDSVSSIDLVSIARAIKLILLGEGGLLQKGQRAEQSHDVHYLAQTACRLVLKLLEQKGINAAAFDECTSLLIGIVDATPSTADPNTRDAVSHAINSPKGVSVEALIVCAIRRKKELEGSEGADQSWNNIAQTMHAEADKLRVGNYEFATMVGTYLPSVQYLKRDWVDARFDDLFSSDNEGVWRASHQGLAYSRGAHNDVFDLLKARGEIVRALSVDFAGTHVHEFLVNQIGIQYLRDREQLDSEGDLVNWLLARKEKAHLNQLAQLLWQVRDADDAAVRGRGTRLWARLSSIGLANPREYKDLLSHLTMLATWIDRLDAETTDTLKRIAPYARVSYNENYVIEQLNRLVTEFPSEVVEVFMALMTDHVPTYDSETIQKLLKQLLLLGKQDEVRRICARYVQSGATNVVGSVLDALMNDSA